jgi:hypothetical protein
MYIYRSPVWNEWNITTMAVNWKWRRFWKRATCNWLCRSINLRINYRDDRVLSVLWYGEISSGHISLRVQCSVLPSMKEMRRLLGGCFWQFVDDIEEQRPIQVILESNHEYLGWKDQFISMIYCSVIPMLSVPHRLVSESVARSFIPWVSCSSSCDRRSPGSIPLLIYVYAMGTK